MGPKGNSFFLDGSCCICAQNTRNCYGGLFVYAVVTDKCSKLSQYGRLCDNIGITENEILLQERE